MHTTRHHRADKKLDTFCKAFVISIHRFIQLEFLVRLGSSRYPKMQRVLARVYIGTTEWRG